MGRLVKIALIAIEDREKSRVLQKNRMKSIVCRKMLLVEKTIVYGWILSLYHLDGNGAYALCHICYRDDPSGVRIVYISVST